MAQNNDPNVPRFRTFANLQPTNMARLRRAHLHSPAMTRYASNLGAQSADVQQFATMREAWRDNMTNAGDVHAETIMRHNKSGAGYLNVPTQTKSVPLYTIKLFGDQPSILIPKNASRIAFSLNSEAILASGICKWSYGPPVEIAAEQTWVGNTLTNNVPYYEHSTSVSVEDIYVWCKTLNGSILVQAFEATVAPEANAI